VKLLHGVEGVGVAEFKAEDVVRHKLVERIVRAYDADAERGRAKLHGEGAE
jgi:phosphate starvation-inducible PhoH-like protein